MACSHSFAHGTDLGEQLVFAHLQAAALGRPVCQKAQDPEGRGPKNVDGGAQAIEDLQHQQLVRATVGDAFTFPEHLARDVQILGCRTRSRDPMGPWASRGLAPLLSRSRTRAPEPPLSELPCNGVDYPDGTFQVELGEVLLAQHRSKFCLQLPPQFSYSIG
jgi:hypothetical protein